MALIRCPECNNEISDSAKKCVHCGYKLKNNNKGLKKSIIIALIIVSIVFLTIPSTLRIIKNAQKRNEELSKDSYKKNIESITYDILFSSIDAESCGNDIKLIWYNTIYEIDDEKTDKYTKVNGIFNDDFNDSLKTYFYSETYIEYNNNIEDSKRKIRNSISELKNPPEEYKEAYNDLKELYESYLTLAGICTNPRGNLQTYSSDFNAADTRVLNDYDKMLLYIED